MIEPEAPTANRRAAWSGEPSPWLLEQLGGPVGWLPWHARRLEEARARDCPVLLVVASAGCLPFAQMARESFADPATAAVMNAGHVCVLADAAWHPSLDAQLQRAHQLLAGRAGGWPLVALVDPLDARPYFAGTYLPAQATGLLPGFRDFLQQALAHHRRSRPALLAQGERLATAFAKLAGAAAADSSPEFALDRAPRELARRQLADGFDAASGVFTVEGAAVPAALACRRLLRHWLASADGAEPDLHALYLATRALSLAPQPQDSPQAAAPDWLMVNAAAARLTGESLFAAAAERWAASLLANGVHPLDWQALAVAGRWLGRDEWVLEAGRHHGDWRGERDPITLPSATLASALAAARALPPVGCHGDDVDWSRRLAEQLVARLTDAGEPALPGLAAAPVPAEDGHPAGLGNAIRQLQRHAQQAQQPAAGVAAQRLLGVVREAVRAAPTRHLALLETQADRAGEPDMEFGPATP